MPATYRFVLRSRRVGLHRTLSAATRALAAIFAAAACRVPFTPLPLGYNRPGIGLFEHVNTRLKGMCELVGDQYYT